jgi:N-acetylglucosaminyl-diphospho-decaprenol L-rhamnosyltransferase
MQSSMNGLASTERMSMRRATRASSGAQWPDGQLGVVMVNYKSADLVIRSVGSIVRQGIAAASHIVIVDNDSQDGSVDRIRRAFPNLRVIASKINDGFGAGVNIGLNHVRTKYVLVLNPDTYFANNSIFKAVFYMMDHPDVAIVGLDLVHTDGRRQYSARRFYSLLDVAARRIGIAGRILRRRVDRHLMKDAWRDGLPFDAEWVMGTGFIADRDVLTALGGMDQTYFLYMEDVDLCARVWQAGFRVACIPNARLVHDHQRSSAKNPFRFAARQHVASLTKFAAKFPVPVFRPPGIDGLCGPVHAKPAVAFDAASAELAVRH